MPLYRAYTDPLVKTGEVVTAQPLTEKGSFDDPKSHRSESRTGHLMVADIAVALVVATALCIAFKSLRGTAVLCVLLLFLIYPWMLIATLTLGAVVVCIIHFHRRSKYRALPKLDDRRD